MKRKMYLKSLAVFLSACLFLSSCSCCSLSDFVGRSDYYQFAFKEDGCIYAAYDAAGKIGGKCSIVTHVKEISASGEEKLLAEIPTSAVCYGEGRFWYSLCGTLFSCTLEGDDLRVELKGEKKRRLTPIGIKKGRLLLYGFYPKLDEAKENAPYSAAYIVFDKETGKETFLCEPSVQVRYNDSQSGQQWNGEEFFCLFGRENQQPCRIGPEGCSVVFEQGFIIGLAEDGTAYWGNKEGDQLEICMQKEGEEPECFAFTFPQYVRQTYLTDDGQVMLAAFSNGLWSLYRFTPKTGEMAVIFANRYQGYEYFFFDKENYYGLSPSEPGFVQGPLEPLYYLT